METIKNSVFSVFTENTDCRLLNLQFRPRHNQLSPPKARPDLTVHWRPNHAAACSLAHRIGQTIASTTAGSPPQALNGSTSLPCQFAKPPAPLRRPALNLSASAPLRRTEGGLLSSLPVRRSSNLPSQVAASCLPAFSAPAQAQPKPTSQCSRPGTSICDSCCDLCSLRSEH